MKSICRFALAGAVAVLASTFVWQARAEGLPPAKATPAATTQPFATGFYVGVNGGHSVATTDVDVGVTGFGSLLSLDGLGHKGTTWGGQGGFDVRIAGTPWVFGLFAEYHQAGAEFDLSLLAPIGSLVNVQIAEQIKAGARLGFVTGRAMIYVGGFWTTADMDWRLGNAGLGFQLTGSERLNGYGALVGLEYALTDFVTVGAQYAYTDFGAMRFSLGGGTYLEADTNAHEVTARLNVRLQDLFGK